MDTLGHEIDRLKANVIEIERIRDDWWGLLERMEKGQ